MKFQVDFNKFSDDRLLKELGAYIVWIDSDDYTHNYYEIEIRDLQHLLDWIKEVQTKTGKLYSAIIDIDPNTIYLDENC